MCVIKYTNKKVNEHICIVYAHQTSYTLYSCIAYLQSEQSGWCAYALHIHTKML